MGGKKYPKALRGATPDVHNGREKMGPVTRNSNQLLTVECGGWTISNGEKELAWKL